MDPGRNSDSEEEESVCGSRSWEVVASDPDSGLSDSNCDVQMHEAGITVLPQHFLLPPAAQACAQESKAVEEEESSRGREPPSSSVKDWIEPSRVIDERQGSGQQEQHHRQQQQQHDLDLLSTLISSVLESEKREGGIAEGGDLQIGTGEEASSLASLHREIVSESGFSALVPSDLHGNVLRPEEQEEGEAIGEEEGGGFGIGEEEDGRIGGSWKKTIASYIRRASTLWSLTIAAALVGLVIIGQRWQHERWQNHQMRLQLCYKDEKISQLLFQIARLKETVSGRRRVPVIKASAV
ncbi:hypothetical protein SELMODRAFT_437818 [Selaginella moellendorffii]|uniref:DUF6821 domain-containing protein n=2 Tax=Selaginella moellendorffii TaxID=88036 RepID=D8QTY6_SELML|nr:hypothetical protein SELMODRAFT_437818 [Selaginella moellendorffii]